MPTKETATTPEKIADDMASVHSRNLNTMSGVGIAWVEALSDMGSEVMSFVAERIKEDVKTQHRILHCKDANELREIQAEFMQKAIDQYTAETGKLVEISHDLMTSGAKTKN